MDKTAWDAMEFARIQKKTKENSILNEELIIILEEVIEDFNKRGIMHSPLKASVIKILNKIKISSS